MGLKILSTTLSKHPAKQLESAFQENYGHSSEPLNLQNYHPMGNTKKDGFDSGELIDFRETYEFEYDDKLEERNEIPTPAWRPTISRLRVNKDPDDGESEILLTFPTYEAVVQPRKDTPKPVAGHESSVNILPKHLNKGEHIPVLYTSLPANSPQDQVFKPCSRDPKDIVSFSQEEIDLLVRAGIPCWWILLGQRNNWDGRVPPEDVKEAWWKLLAAKRVKRVFEWDL